MTGESEIETRTARTPYAAIVVTFVCVLVIGMGLAWAFLSMRAVAGVGAAVAPALTTRSARRVPTGRG